MGRFVAFVVVVVALAVLAIVVGRWQEVGTFTRADCEAIGWEWLPEQRACRDIHFYAVTMPATTAPAGTPAD